MIKCTRAPGGQPATVRRRRHARPALTLLLACTAAAASVLGAQSATGAGPATGTLTAPAALYAAPGSRPLATLRPGAALAIDSVRGEYVRVALEGWLSAPLLGPARESFARTVRAGGGVRLRASPATDGTIVAELRGGMGLDELRRDGSWVRVRRHGWVRSRLVRRPAATAPAPAETAAPPVAPPVADAPPEARPEPVDDDATVLTPTAETALAASPEGAAIGALAPGARATVTAREKGWVRVRIEGWAMERDFTVADSGLRGALSAADLRADPDGTRGRLVHWEVLVLAHQTADPLRRGLVNGEPYLLAQGPGRENALLYLAIPPSLAATARDIPDLAQVTVTARVRHGRSEPVGVPVLELLTLVRR